MQNKTPQKAEDNGASVPQKDIDKIERYLAKEREHARLVITDFRKLEMYKTPVSAEVCRSYGWSNDSMGEIFQDGLMYCAKLSESHEELIIIPVESNSFSAGDKKISELSNSYNEGKVAFENNKSIDTNPYTFQNDIVGEYQFYQWENGWKAARNDSE